MYHKHLNFHEIVRQDNAGKNRKLITLAHAKDWKLNVAFENTAHKTPQQNSKAETGLTVIAAKARTMLSVVQVPTEECYKMSGEE